jgi:malonate-semialdehyde dehydrogenase (acetylating)/methylmalonate-semialdehyde dehydrogenase
LVCNKLVDYHEYGNGVAIFTYGAAARFCQPNPDRYGRRQCGDPGTDGVSQVWLWKRSLFSDMAVYGPEGVRFYTRLKTVTAPKASAAAPNT